MFGFVGSSFRISSPQNMQIKQKRSCCRTLLEIWMKWGFNEGKHKMLSLCIWVQNCCLLIDQGSMFLKKGKQVKLLTLYFTLRVWRHRTMNVTQQREPDSQALSLLRYFHTSKRIHYLEIYPHIRKKTTFVCLKIFLVICRRWCLQKVASLCSRRH